MRIGASGTVFPNFHGYNGWAPVTDQGACTDLHLAVIETVCEFRKSGGTTKSSIDLLNSLADIVAKAEIFRPIIEIWETLNRGFIGLDDKKPVDHELAGKRAILIQTSYVKRKVDDWIEMSGIIAKTCT